MRFVTYMTPGFPASLFEAMARELDAELHVETATSGPGPGEDPFGDGRYDLGWICSTSYVDLMLRPPDPSVTLTGVAWVPDDPAGGGRPVYFGDLVTAPGSGVEDLADLRGRRIGCNDPVSLSGHHALRFAIDDLGEDPDEFASLVFTGGHQASLDAVAAGELDAAVVDSVVRTSRARTDPEIAALALVDRLGPWPVQPLVARSSLDAVLVDEVRETLLAASATTLAGELHDAALSHLVEVDGGHYEPVRAAIARA